jgi:F0F1-type ATP synthase assembly protein I
MKSETKSAPASADNLNAAKILASTIVSTSVRVFGPTLGLFSLGIVVDFTIGSKPIGMIAGVILGGLIAVWLVVKQIKQKPELEK